MKWALCLLLAVHGLIHLLGFVKEFNLATVTGFSPQTIIPLSKPASLFTGVLWGLTCAAFLTTAAVFLLHKTWWWMPAFAAVLLSQALIVLYWKDAKWGTIANLLVFLPALVSFAEWRFTKGVNEEVDHLLSAPVASSSIITKENIAHLPLPVQKWLSASGVVGKQSVQFVRLKQKGLMRLKPESNTWVEGTAEQYFRWDEPSFIWQVKMNMMPLVPVKGRDRIVDGKAAMTIKAFSLFNIVNESGNQKLNKSALQRILSESCWNPSAAVSPFIKWETISENSARATMTYKGVSGDVTFVFSENGNLKACQADRYKDSNDSAQLEKWEVVTKRYGVLDGIRMPVESEVTWKLKEGDFTWYKLVINELEYDKPERYSHD